MGDLGQNLHSFCHLPRPTPEQGLTNRASGAAFAAVAVPPEVSSPGVDPKHLPVLWKERAPPAGRPDIGQIEKLNNFGRSATENASRGSWLRRIRSGNWSSPPCCPVSRLATSSAASHCPPLDNGKNGLPPPLPSPHSPATPALTLSQTKEKQTGCLPYWINILPCCKSDRHPGAPPFS